MRMIPGNAVLTIVFGMREHRPQVPTLAFQCSPGSAAVCRGRHESWPTTPSPVWSRTKPRARRRVPAAPSGMTCDTSSTMALVSWGKPPGVGLVTFSCSQIGGPSDIRGPAGRDSRLESSRLQTSRDAAP